MQSETIDFDLLFSNIDSDTLRQAVIFAFDVHVGLVMSNGQLEILYGC